MDKKAPMFYQSLLHLGFLAGCHHWRLSTFGKWSQLVRQSHRMLVGKEFSYAKNKRQNTRSKQKMYVSSWIFVQFVYFIYHMHHLLNVILEICPSNFDDQLPLSTSASASACRMRPFAELSGFLLSCCLNNPTVHDPTTQKKRWNNSTWIFTMQFLLSPPNSQEMLLIFFVSSFGSIYANSFLGKLQTTFDPAHLVPLGRSDLKSDSCWLPHPRPWSDRSKSRRISGFGVNSWGSKLASSFHSRFFPENVRQWRL